MDHKRRIYITQFLKFNYIGAMTVVLGAAVFVLMIKVGFNYIIALAGDYIVGIIFSYFMNKKYTFKVKTENDIPLLIKTVMMYIVSFILNAILLKLCAEVYGFNLIYSQIVLIFILAVFNFLVYKLLIFRVVNER